MTIGITTHLELSGTTDGGSDYTSTPLLESYAKSGVQDILSPSGG